MLIEQPPQLIRLLYPSALWRMDKKEKSVYLTFDDGPSLYYTPEILDLLEKYNAKATFFVNGYQLSTSTWVRDRQPYGKSRKPHQADAGRDLCGDTVDQR